MNLPTTTREAISECLSTYFLVLAGTGSIVVNQVSGGSPDHHGISAVFGLIVAVMIFAFGHQSGAHMNPAVSLALVAAGRFPARKLIHYLPSQALGAFLGSFTLAGLFPVATALGGTLPSGTPMQSFFLEILLTLLLMLVVLLVADGKPQSAIIAPLAIGATVYIEALFAGPICGASMNPIRSLAPAVVGGHLEHVWVYLSAPTIGALLAVPIQILFASTQKD